MMKQIWKRPDGISLLFGLVLAVETILLLDTVVVFLGGYFKMYMIAGMVILLWIFYCFCPWLTRKGRVILACAIIGIAVVAFAAVYAGWNAFCADAVYKNVDTGKNCIYADKKVMLIVPHQDDDINVLGGVMEEYIKYGSELYVVFATTGDAEGLGVIRINEAIQMCESIGVPEDHVIFLGYGDGSDFGGPHIYNAESGVIIESIIGGRETYGTSEHPAYRQGHAYTIDNYAADMEAVLLEYRPDVIFCVDYDAHIDHRAVSMLFEKTMGRILNSNAEYRPVVYKGFAYNTAWTANPDFHAINIKATQNIYGEPHGQQPEIYRWEDRIRFPVNASTLSRSLISAPAYRSLLYYESQNAWQQAARIINGDKVFWNRSTESLCYNAQLTVSSGQGALLNDFMILEHCNLRDESRIPYDGTWIPTKEDQKKSVTISFEKETDICQVVLYDNPSPQSNVKNAEIVFDNGISIQTGALNPMGAASEFLVSQEGIKEFTVTLLETEGDSAGLTEVEAFSDVSASEDGFIKLMNAEGDFLYDYWISPDGAEWLELYTYGCFPPVDGENYTVESSNPKCSVSIEQGKINVICPKGEATVLFLKCNTVDASDGVYLQNPHLAVRIWSSIMQNIEKHVFSFCSKVWYRRMVVYRLAAKIPGIIS